MVSSAHGIPTVKLWSFDVRSSGPIQATLLDRILASLVGRMVIPVIQKMQRCFDVVLGVESDVATGLRQREAKQFALAGTVLDQE